MYVFMYMQVCSAFWHVGERSSGFSNKTFELPGARFLLVYSDKFCFAKFQVPLENFTFLLAKFQVSVEKFLWKIFKGFLQLDLWFRYKIQNFCTNFMFL